MSVGHAGKHADNEAHGEDADGEEPTTLAASGAGAGR
jgi:hypothetical protein